MMRRVLFLSTCFAVFASVAPARATVAVAIDLSHQVMHVHGAGGNYDWPISSGRSGFTTPNGSYAPIRLESMHYSHKYHMSPMPHAIFFRGGYAIHGTYATADLGRPASHGCVRLSPGNATRLFEMVKAEGARISISGSPPEGRRRFAPPPPAEIADAPEAPVTRHAPRRERVARLRTPREFPGYHYIGDMNGHHMYQAEPTPNAGLFPTTSGDLWN